MTEDSEPLEGELEDDEFDDEFEFDCAADRDGNCAKAGSEECEFDCPYRAGLR